VPSPIDRAIRECPRLVDYSRYSMQLEPFLETYGPDRVLPVFFERLIRHPQEELRRVCAFLGYAGRPRWHADENRRNVSNERLRTSRVRDAVVWNPAVTWVRRRFVPQTLRDRVKRFWQMKEHPTLDQTTRSELERIFDDDLSVLGRWIGTSLTCENFKSVVADRSFDFGRISQAASA
jgi:hypothetical protein